MSISVGDSPIAQMFVGADSVKEVYYGADLVWQNVPQTKVNYNWEDARTSPYRIMFMGSSTTQGYGTAHSEGFTPQMVAHIVSNLLPVPATAPITRNSGSVSSPSANGFHFLNAGAGGTNSQTYWGDNRKNLVSGFQPRLMIHMIGSNDYSTGMAPTTYKQNVERAISEVNNRSAGCRHLLIHSFRREDVSNPAYSWDDYRDQLKAIASSRTDTDFCDAERVLGDGWTGTDLLLADNIHANWLGNTLLARAVSEYLRLDTHEGELVYQLSLLNSQHLTNGTRLGSWAPTPGEGAIIDLPVTATGDNRPVIRNRSGVVSADFYNGAKKMQTAAWPGAVAAPLTVIIVARMWNDNFGTNIKPLFTRSTRADDGYLWAWRDTNNNLVKAAMNSGVSPGSSVPRSVIDSPTITAFTFHPNGWTTLRINATFGIDIPPQSPVSSNGPWMKSLKLMTNTGEDLWGEADLYGIYIFKGATDEMVAEKMLWASDRHNIEVSDPASGDPSWTFSDDFSYPNGTWIDQTGDWSSAPNTYPKANGRGHWYRDAPNNNINHAAIFPTQGALPANRAVAESTFVIPDSYSTESGVRFMVVLQDQNNVGLPGNRVALSVALGQYWVYTRDNGVDRPGVALSSHPVTAGDVLRVQVLNGVFTAMINGSTVHEEAAPHALRLSPIYAGQYTSSYHTSGGQYRGAVEADSFRMGSFHT